MRLLSEAFKAAQESDNREPRYVVRIRNDHGHLWLTSHSDVTPNAAVNDQVFAGSIVSAGGPSQSIEPEKGFSTIGSLNVKIADLAFSEALQSLKTVHDDTINNNPVDILWGYEGLDVDDYALVFRYFITGHSNDAVSYTIKLSDTQRLQKRKVFTAKTTQLVGIVEGNSLVDLTTATQLNGSGVMELLDAADFQPVEHDAAWESDPNKTVGYFSIKGVDAAGNNISEVFSYTGIDGNNPNRVTGVTRSRFGTGAIEAKGTISDGSTDVEEFIYLDMPVPKLILAVLTGDLYGQAGATLPDHWHAGLGASDVDLASFLAIGADLWALPFSFEGQKDGEAKAFIATELLRPCNLFIKINQAGEMELRRFAEVSPNAAPAQVFDELDIIDMGDLERDATHLRNRFLINWEWRSDIEQFVRHNLFIDDDSIGRNNILSDTLTLNFKGVRNRSRSQLNSLQSLAQGIRTRYSDPAIKPTITVPVEDAIALEIGDIVGIDRAQFPDYANGPDIGLAASFEIQSASFDLIRQTITFGLFTTSGTPQPIDFGHGDEATNINHTGWKHLASALTSAGIGYVEDSGTLTVTASGTLAGGPDTSSQYRYYYDGNVILQSGITLTVTQNFVLDARDIDLRGATITAKEQGYTGGAGSTAGNQVTAIRYTEGTLGYFGGLDLAEEGVHYDNRTGSRSDRIRRRSRPTTGAGPAHGQIESFNVQVDENGQIVGLPVSLIGSSGSGGHNSQMDDGAFFAGGDGGKSGGAVLLIAENVFTNSSTLIDTSGGNAERGEKWTSPFGDAIVGGAGGPGYPGCLLTLIKNRSAPIPIYIGRHRAYAGIVNNPHSVDQRPTKGGSWKSVPDDLTSGPYIPIGVTQNRGRDFSSQARLVKYLTADAAAPQTPGVDNIGPAELPDLNLQYLVNEPKSPLGNLVTVTITANPPADPNYQHANFGYRLKGQSDWLPVQYGIRNESTVTVIADGSTYEFRARSVSVPGQVSTGQVVAELMVPSITPGDPGNPEAPVVPKPARLELVNRINDDEGWNQWKGPAPIIRWAKLSTTLNGTLVSPAGREDLHLKGYRLRFFDADGEQVHETTTQENTYTYGLEKNRLDNGGNASRVFRVGVQALADTGFASDWTYIDIENPQPAAPANIRIAPGFTSLNLVYDLPNDVDFVGVDVFLAEGTADPFSSVQPLRLAGNTHTAEGLKPGQQYQVGMRSVDQFGHGQQSAVISISTQAITSEALGDITTPLTLDENGGRVVTNNSGFLAILGAVARPDVSSNPLIFHAWDGEVAPFWMDAAGRFGFGVGTNSISFSGSELTLNEGVSLTFTTNKSVTVGPGGDHATIGAALEYLTRSMPGFKASGAARADILLLDGFEWREQVSIHSLDLSWISVSQESPVTIFTSSFTESIDLIVGLLGGQTMSVRPAISLRYGAKSPKFSGQYSLQVDASPSGGYNTIVYADDGAVFYAQPGSTFAGDPTQASVSSQYKGDGFIISDNAIVETDDCTFNDFYRTFYAKNAKVNAARGVMNRPSYGFFLQFNATALFDDGEINECGTSYASLSGNSVLQGIYLTLNNAAAGVSFSVGNSTLNVESITHSSSNNTNYLFNTTGGRINLGVLRLDGPGGIMSYVVLGGQGCYCTVMNIIGSGYYAAVANFPQNQTRPEGIIFSTVI